VKTSGAPQAYALKVQSKYELVESGQAKAVVEEKNIMASLHSPFIISLVTTYKDDSCVYMLMELVQGGELYSVMRNGSGGMNEQHAKFYVAGIGEGLLYMHRRGICYRDLKPENVLIGNTGYPVIIDFGFAKKVKYKTFTLCGTVSTKAATVVRCLSINAHPSTASLPRTRSDFK
jgi:serine/threonine protein kinase